jgi:hypothetical protein
VGKEVSFRFLAASFVPYEPGISFIWRESAAQGSCRVIIDGIDRGLIWQGDGSSSFVSFPLNPGIHTIRLVKPARDGDRKISIHSFYNGVGPPPSGVPPT